jgi:hypothetical protein
MASVERTAYPRFRRFMSARELCVFYTPAAEEIAWAGENASSDEHLLGLVIQLKTFSRLGYFPALDEVPAEVVGHIRRSLRLPEATRPVYASTRTAERHRNLIRERSEVVYDPAGARKVAAEAIEEAARRKNDPADLINIALERLVEGSYELPAFRTLNDMAATIRARVNEEIFAVVAGRLGLGVGSGDVVAVVAKNSADFLVHAFALMRAGATPAFVNWRLSPRELTEVLALVEPKAIAADAEFAGLVEAAWPEPSPGSSSAAGRSRRAGWTARRFPGSPGRRPRGPRSPATRCWPWCTPAAPPAGPRPSRCGTAR